MKKILVPVDFSDNSLRALDFAVELANRFLSAITVFHVLPPGRSEKMDQYLTSNAEEELEKLLHEYRPRLKKGTSITGSSVLGQPVETISDYAEKGQYDLIVMSTQGEAGLKGFLMGSTTLDILRQTTIPLLAIPGETSVDKMQLFLLALDERGVQESVTLEPFRQLAGAFKATVTIYHQTEKQHYPVPSLLVDAALEGVDHSFHQETTGAEVSKGILQYAEEQDADLLCLIRRERNFFQKLFHHSVTREELSAAAIPMLILHEQHGTP